MAVTGFFLPPGPGGGGATGFVLAGGGGGGFMGAGFAGRLSSSSGTLPLIKYRLRTGS